MKKAEKNIIMENYVHDVESKNGILLSDLEVNVVRNIILYQSQFHSKHAHCIKYS